MKPLHERRRRSAREKFQSCKASYAGDYVYEVDGQNDYTRRGSLFHDARHRYIVALWRSRQTDDHELAERAWTEASTANPIPHQHRADARSLFLRWIERFKLNLDTYVDSETELMTHYGSMLRLDEVHVVGPDHIRIIDAKTYWRIPSDEELRNELQVAFYLGAVRKLFPAFTRREFVFDMVRFGVQVTVSLSESELDEFDALAAEQDVAMAKAEVDGDYPATPGDHCRMCVLQCDAVDHALRAPARVIDGADAKRAVKHLAVLHRQQEQLQAALKVYSDFNGPVEAGGIEWAHRPETRSVYPAGPVLDVLHRDGFDYNLLASGSSVKPLITSKRKYLSVADDIKALAVTKTATKFGPKRTHDLDAEPQEETVE
jgi:hypothetical protein